MELPPSRTVRRHGEWTDAHDHCVLSYEKRFLRRRVLETARVLLTKELALSRNVTVDQVGADLDAIFTRPSA